MELQGAIDRGDVIINTNAKGVKMYYFPSCSMGSGESVQQHQTLSKKKQVAAPAFDVVSKFMQSLGWSLKANQKQLEVAHPFCVCGFF